MYIPVPVHQITHSLGRRYLVNDFLSAGRQVHYFPFLSFSELGFSRLTFSFLSLFLNN